MRKYFHVFWVLLTLAVSPLSSQSIQNLQQTMGQNNVLDIYVHGLDYSSVDMVLRQMSLKKQSAYSPIALKDGVKHSIKNLHQSGLFANVSIKAEYVENTSDIYLHVYVKENPRLGKFNILGFDELTEEDLETQLTLVEGQIYSEADLERNRQRIIQYYKNEGFLLVEVSIEKYPNPDKPETDVTFRVHEGQKVKVANVIIDGNNNVSYDELISNLESDIDNFWSDGEFSEDAFLNDVDSIISVYKSKGFLDIEVTDKKKEYHPDSSFHFYLGRVAEDPQAMNQLLKSVNKDLENSGSPMFGAANFVFQNTSHYYRKFRNQRVRKASTPDKIVTEEKLKELLNRTLNLSEGRRIVQKLAEERKFQNPEIKTLYAKERTEFEDKRLTRLIFEDLYALKRYDDIATSSKLSLHFTVSEGRQYYVGDFTFLGNKVYDDEILESQITLNKGDVFNYSEYQLIMHNVQSLYREKGYLFVNVKEKKTYQDSILSIAMDITEGKPASINKVYVVGNTTTKDKVIRRELHLFPGDTYRQSRMERSIRDVMQLNYFDNALPDIQVVGEQEVDLIVSVTEREAGTGQFSAGMAYSQSDGLLGTVGLSIPNCCLGDGQKADLNVEYGQDKKNYSVGFTEPWFNDTPTEVGAALNYTWWSNRIYSSNDEDIVSYGGRLTLGRRLTWPDDYFRIGSSLNFQRTKQGENVEDNVILNTGIETSLGLTLIRDDKNLPIFPTEGSRYVLSYQKAFNTSAVFGTSVDYFDFSKTEFTVKWWFPLIGSLALGLDNQIGILNGAAIENNARYQMGGMLGYEGKMRGYSSGSIGSARLGRSYYAFTAELTYPIAENRFYVLGFFDAGNVYGQKIFDKSGRFSPVAAGDLDNPLSEMDLSDLKRDYGFGFRAIVPMLGIIGFDFAWPMDDGDVDRYGNKSTNRGMNPQFVIGRGF